MRAGSPVDGVVVKTGGGPAVERETADVTQLRRLSGGSKRAERAASINQPVNLNRLKSY